MRIGHSLNRPAIASHESEPRCWAIILAGGSGKRLGMDRPKAFVPLAGRPLLAWSLLAFARHKAVTDLVVVVPRGWGKELHKHVLGPLGKELGVLGAKIHKPVVGGKHRQDSVLAGLAAASRHMGDEIAEETPVLIHDAARPIVAPELVSELLTRLRSAHQSEPGVAGAVPVLPVGDTLKAVKGRPLESGRLSRGRVVSTVPRRGLWRVQTPQAFCLAPLLEAHQEATIADLRVTDDAMLYEWMGWPIETVPGSSLSMKVTYPEDLALLGAWLSASGTGRLEHGSGAPTRRRLQLDSLDRSAGA